MKSAKLLCFALAIGVAIAARPARANNYSIAIDTMRLTTATLPNGQNTQSLSFNASYLTTVGDPHKYLSVLVIAGQPGELSDGTPTGLTNMWAIFSDPNAQPNADGTITYRPAISPNALPFILSPPGYYTAYFFLSTANGDVIAKDQITYNFTFGQTTGATQPAAGNVVVATDNRIPFYDFGGSVLTTIDPNNPPRPAEAQQYQQHGQYVTTSNIVSGSSGKVIMGVEFTPFLNGSTPYATLGYVVVPLYKTNIVAQGYRNGVAGAFTYQQRTTIRYTAIELTLPPGDYTMYFYLVDPNGNAFNNQVMDSIPAFSAH